MIKWTLLIALLAAGLSGNTQPGKAERIRELLAKEEADGFSGSVLVAEGSTVLFEGGLGMADREDQRKQTAATVFSVGSITKQFTAAAILKLEAQGKLSVTDKLSHFFPDAPEDKKNITVHQLLTHTSGLPEVIGDDYDTIDGAHFLRLAFNSDLVAKPGESYLYSNVGYSLLGLIVASVSGKGYEEFLHDELFVPAGMYHTGYLIPRFSKNQLAVGYRNGKRWGTALDRSWLSDGPGWHLRANGGILSTASDMYAWYLALKNKTVLPKIETDKYFTPFVAEGPDSISYYGYGWVVQDLGESRLIWHNGGNGVYNAFAGFDLNQDLFLFVSSNTNNKISDRIAAELYNTVSEKAKMKLMEERPDFQNNPVVKKILDAIRQSGAGEFSKNYREILGRCGFDFKEDMILLAVGQQLEENQRWKEGIALFSAFTDLFPEIVVAWNRLGICYKQDGNIPQAKASWEKSLSIRKQDNRAAQWLKEIE